MLKYFGGPITPIDAAIAAWKGAHALVSYAYPSQCSYAANVADSFALDNGAFTAWKKGKAYDFSGYISWVMQWRFHPGFDWCLIPDIIDGTEAENNQLITCWGLPSAISVPVWHLHESLEKLDWLVSSFPRVAFGSSGTYRTPGSDVWWGRMEEAMRVACDVHGRPRAKLHGLRMMNPTIFAHVPFGSVDSATIALNIGKDVVADRKWSKDPYPPLTKAQRAIAMRWNIESHASAARWVGTSRTARNPELLG